MALLNIREINPATYLGFWEISETAESLRNALQDLTSCQLVIPEFASASRQKQWLSSRILVYTLLQNFTAAYFPLQTSAAGKPIFPEEKYQVSITHSHTLVGVILAKGHKVGIDIEIISPKVMRVVDKFMCGPEIEDAGGNLEKTLVYWSAKETLYKLYSKKKLIFKDHLLVEPFALHNTGALTTLVKTPGTENTFTVYYEHLNGYILTYCVSELNDII
ncbi:siderophore biosynthesis protein [Adhaeribacter aerolatus]|uniref:Siderophore biosynthesis protein n=1 Tax=Adhaeribacter aerolatus TaxID=670289 RepID=A0A512B3A4_9BACT|nr:4'-phosphopantetheinyl transferase family protein [Adhaeribacter aerolatus]GEO06438.1 siderophore biosynthesis protein [Adhaeribacter aerolatus]